MPHTIACYAYIDSSSRLFNDRVYALPHPYTTNLLDAEIEPWLDDDFVDRKDALDCDCVPFESVEAQLCEDLFEQDRIDSGYYEPDYIEMED